MLTILAYSMIIVFMFLIMTKRLPAMVALIVVPIAFGVVGGFGPELGPMMLTGIKNLAPTGVMLMFAILYFGIMIDAGLFDPVIRRLVKMVRGDPMKIVVGTAALAMFVSLDGDGATAYMITVSAMLPLYQRLGMNQLILACVIMLAGGSSTSCPGVDRPHERRAPWASRCTSSSCRCSCPCSPGSPGCYSSPMSWASASASVSASCGSPPRPAPRRTSASCSPPMPGTPRMPPAARWTEPPDNGSPTQA